MGADFLNPAACVELIAGAAVGSTGNAVFGDQYPSNVTTSQQILFFIRGLRLPFFIMPFPTTNATQELPAINQILTSCGQAPVTTLDQTNPEVAIAYATLLQVSREIQAEGWTFNKEYHYEFTPDNNKEILLSLIHI